MKLKHTCMLFAAIGLLFNNACSLGSEDVDTETGIVTTIAGKIGGAGSANGVGCEARFNYPAGAVLTDYYTMYVCDRGNYTIRKINTATGEVTLFAGKPGVQGTVNGTGTSARFTDPVWIASDGTYLYVSDAGDYTIRKINIVSKKVTVLTGVKGKSDTVDGVYGVAKLTNPTGLVYVAGYLYAGDGCTIRRIDPVTGEMSTFAGLAGNKVHADGIGSAAGFKNVAGLTTDGADIYAADSYDYRIRKIIVKTGEVSTIAGTGWWGDKDETGTAAEFCTPEGIAYFKGFLYVGDYLAVRKINMSDMSVIKIMGCYERGSDNGVGAAASFNHINGIATNGDTLFICDGFNNAIRNGNIATNHVTVLAGAPNIGFTDGTGLDASFSCPTDIATDGANLYICDSGNYTIRKMVIATGEVSTIAGSHGNCGWDDGTGSAASFGCPSGIVAVGDYLYVCDSNSSLGNHTIRKIEISSGTVTTFAGKAKAGEDYADGAGENARFGELYGIASDGENLYVCDQNYLRKIVLATAEVTTMKGRNFLSSEETVASGEIASLFSGNSVVVDDGYLYVTGPWWPGTRKISLTSGEVSSVLGETATGGLSITGDGSMLYLFQMYRGTVSAVNIAQGTMSILAGYEWKSGYADGTGKDVRFGDYCCLVQVGKDLYVSDSSNHVIRKIVIP